MLLKNKCLFQNEDKYDLENVDDHYNDGSVPEAKHTKQKSKIGKNFIIKIEPHGPIIYMKKRTK